MGRTGSGVEIREKSIRLTFVYEGKPQRETLMLNGKPMLPTPANLKYAERLAREIRDKIRHGTFSMAEYFPASGNGVSPITLSSLLDTFLSTVLGATSTKAGYRAAARFWKTAAFNDTVTPLGTLLLRRIKPSMLKAAIARRPELSGKTVNNYVSVLREALQLAVDDKIIDTNPADKLPRAKWQKEPPDPFTQDEAEAIIAHLAQHQPGQVHNLVEWWFFTGVRTSEAFGLQWTNVDLRSKSVTIKEALVRGERKGTKTNQVRHVFQNPRAMAALQRQAQHTRLAGTDVWQDPRYQTGWVDERAFRRSFWEPTLKKLGIRYRRPYQMRHTYASLLLMQGRRPAWCAKQLGHSVEIFLRTYAKWQEGDHDQLEMQELESALSSPVLPQTGESGAKSL